MNSSSESMSIAPMIDLLVALSSGAQAPGQYLPPVPAQLRRERLNCIVEPKAHAISRGIKVGADGKKTREDGKTGRAGRWGRLGDEDRGAQ